MNRPPDHSTPEQRGWYIYDFAQTAFSTTVITLFLGPYLTVLAKAAADARGMVHPLGIPVDARSYWSYMVSLSVVLQVIFLPIVGAIADYGRRKKEVMAAVAYLGAAATVAMFLLEGSHYLFGGALFLIANVSFGAGVWSITHSCRRSHHRRIATRCRREDGAPGTWEAACCWR